MSFSLLENTFKIPWLCVKYHRSINILFSSTVLDVQAFERLLGPCKELLMRNIPLYEQQLSQIYQDLNVNE